MLRFVQTLGTACLLSLAGLVVIGLTAWGVHAVGLTGLLTPLLVVGPAVLLPMSMVAAERIVPGGPHHTPHSGWCPLCGAPTSVGSKPPAFDEFW